MKGKISAKVTIGLSVVFLAIGLRLTLSFYSVENLPPSSDEALSMLLAKSISKGESYPLLFTGQPYQFPVEAYILSTYVEYLGNAAIDARLQLIVFGFLTVLGYIYICYLIFKKGQRWPALMLVLFPSSYLLLHQSAQLVPQYSATGLFAALLFILAIKINSSGKPSYLLTLIFGVIAGLSLSNHLLVISVVAGATVIVLATGKFIDDIKKVPFMLLGGIIGLIPMILAIITIPGSYNAISSRIDWTIFANRIYDTVVFHSLPGAFGINPPYYADYPVHFLKNVTATKIFLVLFFAILLLVLAKRIFKYFVSIKNAKWINLSWPDMFIVTTVSSIILMAMNIGAGARDHRYLLPVVWSFPFLVGYIYTTVSTRFSHIVGFVAMSFVLVNILTSAVVIRTWRNPTIIQEYSGIHDITAINDWMESNGIGYCYATFWLAYRFVYETAGKTICGPPYNERFKGWPIPYKKQVDEKENVAYVMSETYGTKFPASKFESILEKVGVSYEKLKFGRLYLYHKFMYPPAVNDKLLNSDEYSISSSTSSVNLNRLSDNDARIAINFKSKQYAGQYLAVKLDKISTIQRVDLVHPIRERKPANSVMIYGMVSGLWKPLLKEPKIFVRNRFRFDNKHPIFGEYLQTIRFPPEQVEAIKIMIVSPNTSSTWTLSEIRLGTKIEK